MALARVIGSPHSTQGQASITPFNVDVWSLTIARAPRNYRSKVGILHQQGIVYMHRWMKIYDSRQIAVCDTKLRYICLQQKSITQESFHSRIYMSPPTPTSHCHNGLCDQYQMECTCTWSYVWKRKLLAKWQLRMKFKLTEFACAWSMRRG